MTTQSDQIDELITKTTELLSEVAGQKDRLVGASNIASDKASEAATYAQKATEEAAKATQISGLDTVDSALEKRAGEFIGDAVFDISGGRVKQILDANGNYNTMFSIPVFTYDDVGLSTLGNGVFPAFLKENGDVIPEIWVSVYAATNIGGNPVSKANSAPYVNINIGDASNKCKSMGSGWHLMTVYEWAALCAWCLANSYQPTGNTEFGRSHKKKFQVGERIDGGIPNERSGNPVCRSGSGVDDWSHNSNAFGIKDLVGNVYEWIDGISMQESNFHVSQFNGQQESSWVNTGVYVTSSGNWGSAVFSADNQLLKQLFIQNDTVTSSLEGYLSRTTEGVMYARRGGAYSSVDRAGLGALDLNSNFGTKGSDTGFRAVYIEGDN